MAGLAALPIIVPLIWGYQLIRSPTGRSGQVNQRIHARACM